jgi:hypothetical protein
MFLHQFEAKGFRDAEVLDRAGHPERALVAALAFDGRRGVLEVVRGPGDVDGLVPLDEDFSGVAGALGS